MGNGKKVASEEVALQWVTDFVKKHNAKEFRRGNLPVDKIREEYIDVIEATQDGLLVFDDKNHPTYTLREAIETEDKNEDLAVKTVNFRSRIKPSEKARIADGLDLKTQTAKFSLRYMAFITGLSLGEIDKLAKDDYDTIQQVCAVFS